MANSAVPVLVKDFRKLRIVYYWHCKNTQRRLSPYLASLTLAEEWWLRFNHALHTGEERRQSYIDRRRVTSRSELGRRSYLSGVMNGRRASDMPVRVSENLADMKISEFRLLISEGLLDPKLFDGVSVDTNRLIESAHATLHNHH